MVPPQSPEADGHRVRGSVRSLDDPSRTARRRALGDIELVEARLAF